MAAFMFILLARGPGGISSDAVIERWRQAL
jgi:hypothetical protein